MHTANGLEFMGSFRHAALLFVHTLYESREVLHLPDESKYFQGTFKCSSPKNANFIYVK